MTCCWKFLLFSLFFTACFHPFLKNIISQFHLSTCYITYKYALYCFVFYHTTQSLVTDICYAIAFGRHHLNSHQKLKQKQTNKQKKKKKKKKKNPCKNLKLTGASKPKPIYHLVPIIASTIFIVVE